MNTDRPEGLTSPEQMLTTAEQRIEDSGLRAALFKIEQLRTAVIAAREVARLVGQAGSDHPTMQAADQWLRRFGALADPPLDVEVEADDEDDSHEGPYDVREHTIGVYLRTDGSLERQIGTIDRPDELPTLLHLAADEMVRPA